MISFRELKTCIRGRQQSGAGSIIWRQRSSLNFQDKQNQGQVTINCKEMAQVDLFGRKEALSPSCKHFFLSPSKHPSLTFTFLKQEMFLVQNRSHLNLHPQGCKMQFRATEGWVTFKGEWPSAFLTAKEPLSNSRILWKIWFFFRGGFFVRGVAALSGLTSFSGVATSSKGWLTRPALFWL